MRLADFAACGALVLCLGYPVAVAAQDAATCASGLDATAKLIFDDALADVTAGGDIKTVVTDHTKALVSAGTIGRGEARSSATAAAECLKLAQG